MCARESNPVARFCWIAALSRTISTRKRHVRHTALVWHQVVQLRPLPVPVHTPKRTRQVRCSSISLLLALGVTRHDTMQHCGALTIKAFGRRRGPTEACAHCSLRKGKPQAAHSSSSPPQMPKLGAPRSLRDHAKPSHPKSLQRTVSEMLAQMTAASSLLHQQPHNARRMDQLTRA